MTLYRVVDANVCFCHSLTYDIVGTVISLQQTFTNRHMISTTTALTILTLTATF